MNALEEPALNIDKLFENDIKIIEYDEGEDTLKSDQFAYTLTLKRDNFDTEKQFVGFIKACEKLVRQSEEYKFWRNYLKSALMQSTCVITGELDSETTIDIHHHPACLFDIVKSIVKKYLVSERKFCSFDISSDVIIEHYQNHLGFVPLLSSLHEKFHNGYLDIPMELVRGNYQYWIDNYSAYLEEDDLKMILSRLDINRNNCGWTSYKWNKNNYIEQK